MKKMITIIALFMVTGTTSLSFADKFVGKQDGVKVTFGGASESKDAKDQSAKKTHDGKKSTGKSGSNIDKVALPAEHDH